MGLRSDEILRNLLFSRKRDQEVDEMKKVGAFNRYAFRYFHASLCFNAALIGIDIWFHDGAYADVQHEHVRKIICSSYKEVDARSVKLFSQQIERGLNGEIDYVDFPIRLETGRNVRHHAFVLIFDRKYDDVEDCKDWISNLEPLATMRIEEEQARFKGNSFPVPGSENWAASFPAMFGYYRGENLDVTFYFSREFSDQSINEAKLPVLGLPIDFCRRTDLCREGI